MVSLVTGMNEVAVISESDVAVGTKGPGAINSGSGSRVGRAIGAGLPQ